MPDTSDARVIWTLTISRCESRMFALLKESAMTTTSQPASFTLDDLAALGNGQVAYVRTMRAEDVRKLSPQAEHIPTGVDLFALLGADGTPIMITDSAEELRINASEHQLVTVSVH
jgi:hypothetical protein